MSTTTAKRTIDRTWFRAALATSRYPSYQLLGEQMRNRQGKEMSKHSLWQLINGNRHMTVEDARQLADLLDKPLPEVLRRAGIDVADLGDDIEARQRASAKMVRTLLGFIDEHGMKLPQRIRDAAERAGV